MIPDALRDELRQRSAFRAWEDSFSLLMTEQEAEELWYGRVPKRVREMAKAAFDWYWDDLLAANAAKAAQNARKRTTKQKQKGRS